MEVTAARASTFVSATLSWGKAANFGERIQASKACESGIVSDAQGGSTRGDLVQGAKALKSSVVIYG